MCNQDIIGNILKHKIQFTKIRRSKGIHNLYIESITSTYQSGKIQNKNLVNIYNVEDLDRMVSPFIKYLTSKEKQKRGDDYLIIRYDIQVITYSEEYAEGHQNFTVLSSKHKQKRNDEGKNEDDEKDEEDEFDEDAYWEKKYKESMESNDYEDDYEDDYKEDFYSKNPFRIQIVKQKIYKQKSYEKAIYDGVKKKPRNINVCVVCLTNYSNILFSPCLHWCICEKCERSQSFRKCPYCRSKIYSKINFCYQHIDI